MDSAKKLAELLVDRDLKIAVVESVTGGQLQAAMTSVSGASKYFVGGVTAYNIDQKVKLLGVDREHAASVNCVSAEVAQQMLAGVLVMFDADFAVATTGYAEPWPEASVAEPFAYVAVGTATNMRVEKVDTSHRTRNAAQAFVTDYAIKLALQILCEV